MKKVLVLSLALILLLGIMSGGTSSLFTDTEIGTTTICAWVEVCPPDSMVIVSDTTTQVTEAYTNYSGGTHTTTTTPHAAVAAWVHGNWGPVSTYFAGLGGPTASWIWETEYTDEPGTWLEWPVGWPSSSVTGRVVRFERTFEIPCSPIGAELYITVDNGYSVWINGNLVGSAQVYTGWETNTLTEAYVPTSGWETVKTYTITADKLVAGTNTLVILAANEYMGPTEQGEGTWDSNPAGLIYWLEVEWGY